MNIDHATFGFNIRKIALSGLRTADWLFAKNGLPEKLYGFHSGNIPLRRLDIENIFHG